MTTDETMRAMQVPAAGEPHEDVERAEKPGTSWNAFHRPDSVATVALV